jgi:nitrate reductase NapE component
MPGLVVLSSIKKQTEQAMRNKPVINIPQWPLISLQVVALLGFLSWPFPVMDCDMEL